MKVLFLDFDGVLNSEQSTHYYYRNWVEAGKPAGRSLLSKWNWELCPIAVSNLKFIAENCPDLKIVISSTWRLGETVDYFKDMFKKLGLDPDLVIGLTPVLHGRDRGIEIQTWLDTFDPSKITVPIVSDFVIVDDDADMAHLMDKLVQTSWQLGLTIKDAKKILDRLNPDWRERKGHEEGTS